jgi:hypothetical protein
VSVGDSEVSEKKIPEHWELVRRRHEKMPISRIAGEVARELGRPYSRSAVSSVVRKLRRHGIITSLPDPKKQMRRPTRRVILAPVPGRTA